MVVYRVLDAWLILFEGDDGAVELGKLLPYCPDLEDLKFSSTRAGAKGSLVSAIYQTHNLLLSLL